MPEKKSKHPADRTYVNIECTPEQKAMFTAEAEHDGMAVSAWFRKLGLETARERQHLRRQNNQCTTTTSQPSGAATAAKQSS